MSIVKNFTEFSQLFEDDRFKRVSFFGDRFSESFGKVPIYNQIKYDKNPRAIPEARVNPRDIFPALAELLKAQEEGTVDQIRLFAELYTQGEKTPKYLADELASERARLSAKILDMYGGRVEAKDRIKKCWDCFGTGMKDSSDGGIECTTCKGTGEIAEPPEEMNIYVDAEFVFQGFETINNKEYAIGIPARHERKVKQNPEKFDYYKCKFLPEDINEIFFDPY